MARVFYLGDAVGVSMQPLINQGDKLYIQKTKISDLIRGDIIVFYKNKILVSHRVIRKKKNTVITKGDNNFFTDRPIDSRYILGKLIMIDGIYGRKYLNSRLARWIQYYFLFYSFMMYYPSRLMSKIITSLMKGRSVLVKFLNRDS
jgi:signal peptidase I